MRTVAAAFAAASEGRFDALGAMLATEIDWRGIPDENGDIPRCAGRAEALERMRSGLLSNGRVAVSSLVEEGDRVLAHVHAAGDDPPEPAQRFVVAEVHDGQISQLRGYANEREATDALHGGSIDAPAEAEPQPKPAARQPHIGTAREMTAARIELRPLTSADLLVIAPWFEDPDTRRFLGGPDWPAAMLATSERSIGTTFRGATQTGAHHYLALADGTPVGYIDCGTFDRCTVYGGEGQDGPIILDSIEAITGSIAFAIDPERRHRGLGVRMIRALTGHPDLLDVELFEAGVEPDNTASRRCLEAAGFRVRTEQPDVEGMLYYRGWRADLGGRPVASS
jgi:RimJ/RimL family protein N-acetyltransferase/ketosteroid isomerase-like protein